MPATTHTLPFPSESYAFSDQAISSVVPRIRRQHHQLALGDDGSSGRLGFCISPSHITQENESANPFKHQTYLFKPTFALNTPGGECELPVVRRPPRRWLSAAKREQSRINQARYRDKQRQHFEGLHNSIRELRIKIQDLEMQQEQLECCTPTYTSVWTVASEYFRVFRYGFKAPPTIVKARGKSKTTLAFRPSEYQSQRSFLLSAMSPGVTDGAVSGVTEIHENWKKLSIYYGDTHVQLKRLEQVGENSVLATATIRLTVTEKALAHVYPHFVQDTSATKMLNQRLDVCGSVRFDLDVVRCRVVRLESRFDLVSPMMKLLGNLEDVTRVLDKDYEDASSVPEAH